MKASHFVKKYSVQFINQHGKLSRAVLLLGQQAARIVPDVAGAAERVRQVDACDHARENGVKVHEGVRVLEVLFEGKRAVGVRVKPEDGPEREVRAKVVIDASGQSTHDSWIASACGTGIRI